jgi:hypothetical protein
MLTLINQYHIDYYIDDEGKAHFDTNQAANMCRISVETARKHFQKYKESYPKFKEYAHKGEYVITRFWKKVITPTDMLKILDHFYETHRSRRVPNSSAYIKSNLLHILFCIEQVEKLVYDID